MTIEPVIPGPSPPEDRWFDELRPATLSECIGQKEVIERLAIALNAAQKSGEPLDHLLLDGPPGLGKTTLAMALPRDLGCPIQLTSGAALAKPADLMPYLTNLSPRSALFIDEIHRLPRVVEEFLYPAMEDFRVDLVIGEGLNARTISMQLKPFTVIGATTRTGLISAPLRARFRVHEHLDFYTDDELAQIVLRSAGRLNVPIDNGSAMELAHRSRGTPRLANNRLRWVRNFSISEADGCIVPALARQALDMAGVDSSGLDKQDRKYLETLIRVYHGGPAGIEAVAATMNVSVDTLADDVEPYLLRTAFVVRTRRGREATLPAYKHLGLAPPAERDGDDQKRLF